MAKGWQIDDQLILNRLIYTGQRPVKPTKEDPAVMWAFNNTLRAVFLPVLLCAAFPSGRTPFVCHVFQKNSADD